MKDVIVEILVATRPWSLTAAVIPVLLTAAVSHVGFFSALTGIALLMAVFVQIGANLTNTYFDFIHGVDTKECGERTLVERKLTPPVVLATSALAYGAGTLLLYPAMVAADSYELTAVFAVGIVLAFFYTADPVGLKYHALGDVAIFLCFGPLLMQCTSHLLTGAINAELCLYTIPVSCLTEAILHANNTRDIETDRRAGATTLAALLGWNTSRHLFTLLIMGAYLSAAYLACAKHSGCAMVFLTAPLAWKLLQKFSRKEMQDLEKETAQLHLLFGLLLICGVLATSGGLLL
jgi:1,4-dihydroxy-2-naphthoate octaprenyltransferase